MAIYKVVTSDTTYSTTDGFETTIATVGFLGKIEMTVIEYNLIVICTLKPLPSIKLVDK